MKKVVPSQIATICTAVTVFIFLVLPFHAFMTVWAGSNFGHYDWFRLWIEVALAVLAPLAAVLAWHGKRLRPYWRHELLVWLVVGYIAWQLLLGMWAASRGWVGLTALLTGWATDLRFVVFLLLTWVVGTYRPWLAARWRELLLMPAAVVTAFGIIQAWLLPADFLRHFGYSSATIRPFATVDQKETYVRIQSTLRGPNPLGAYMVPVLTAVGTTLLSAIRTGWRVAFAVFAIAGGVVLAVTYSRSAYLGALLALAIAAWLLLPGARARRWLLLAVCSVVLAASIAFFALRHNDRFQNTFFHTDEHSASAESSNAVRTSSLLQGLQDVIGNPLGGGPGSAGPASVHNIAPPRIAENYYLQIGQEVGWLGLGLFGALNLVVMYRLWQRRSSQLSIVLLASFVGISFINLLSHAWADDTLGMLWWGLAGLALSMPPQPPSPARHAAEAA